MHMLSCVSAAQVLLFQTNFLEEPGFENSAAHSGVWMTGGMNHHHHSHNVRPGLTALQSSAS